MAREADSSAPPPSDSPSPGAAPQPAPQKAKRWLPWRITRGLLLTVFWIVLIVVLIVFATLSIARLPGAQDKLVSIILGQTKASLPGLTIGAIRGDYTSTLSVYDIELRDRFGGEAISLAALHLAYSPWELLSGEVVVEQVLLLQPRIVVKPTQSGKLNVAELVVPSKDKPEKKEPKKEGPPSVPEGVARLEALRIIDGEIVLAMDAKKPPIRIEKLQLDIGASASAKKQRLDLREFSLTAKLPDRPPISLALDVDARVAGEQALIKKGALLERGAKLKLGLTVRGALPGKPLRLDIGADGPLSATKLDIALKLPGQASLGIKGTAGVRAGFVPSFDLTTTLRGLDPKRLLPSLMPGNVNLVLKAKGQGVPLAKGSTLVANLEVEPSKVGPVKVQRVGLDATLEGKRWTLKSLAVRAGKTRVDASGAGGLKKLERLKVDVRAPNLARLPIPVKVPGLAGSLHLRASAKGPFTGPLSAKIWLRGRDLGVAKLKVASVDLDGAFRGLPSKPRGRLKLRAAEIDPGSPDLKVTRAAVDVAGDPRKLTIGVKADGKKLFARVGATVNVANPKQIKATLSRLRFRGFGQRVALQDETKVDLRPGRRVAVRGLKLATYGGVVGLDATLKQVGEPRVAAAVTFRGLVPPVPAKTKAQRRAARRMRVSGRLDAEVRSKGATARARFSVGRRTKISLDARVPLRRRRGEPVPTRPDLRRAAAVTLKLANLQLAPIRALLGEKKLPPLAGRVDLDVGVRGRLTDPTATVELRLADLDAMGLKPVDGRVFAEVTPTRSRVEVDTSIDRKPVLVLRGSADLGAGAFSKGRRPGKAQLVAIPAKLSLKVPRLALQRFAPLGKSLKIDALEQLSGTAKLDLSLDGTARRPALKLDVRLSKGMLDEQRLGELALGLAAAVTDAASTLDVKVRAGATELPARPLVTVAASTKPLDPLVVASKGVGTLPLTAQVRLPGFDLKALRGYLPKLPQLAGKLMGTIDVSGDSKAPKAKAELTLDRLRFTDVPVGDLKVGGDFDGKAMKAGGKVTLTQRAGAAGKSRSTGGSLRAEGRVDLKKKMILAATVKGDKLDLAPYEVLTSQVRTLAGRLSLDLRAEGPFAKPRPRGTVSLVGGKLRLRGMSLYDRLGLDVEVAPERVRLTKLTMRSGEGDLLVTADVSLADLKPQRFNLKARARKLTIGAPPVRDGVFSGKIDVGGAFQPGNKLAVDVRVDDAAFKLGKITGSRSLHGIGPLPDVVFVDAEARKAREAKKKAIARGERPLTIDIGVKADPLMVRADQLDVEVATDLKVAVDDKGARIRGMVQIRRGRIEILSKKYEVQRARVRFSGEKVPNPALDVQLARRFGDAMIYITVRGTAKKPQLEFSSDPAIYDRSQIVSIIVTGRVDPREGGGQTDNTMAVASAVSQALLGSMLSSIAPKVGIDVARVNIGQKTNDKGETQLRAEAEVGKYLTERLYLGYRRVFGASADENANEGLLEFRLTARWLLMAVFGDAGVGGVDALWTYRY